MKLFSFGVIHVGGFTIKLHLTSSENRHQLKSCIFDHPYGSTFILTQIFRTSNLRNKNKTNPRCNPQVVVADGQNTTKYAGDLINQSCPMMSHPYSCNLYPSSRFFLGNTKVLRACCQPAGAKIEMQLPNGVKSFWAYCFFNNFGSYQVLTSIFLWNRSKKRLHLGMAPAILENLRNSSASRIDPPNPSSPCSSNAVHQTKRNKHQRIIPTNMVNII